MTNQQTNKVKLNEEIANYQKAIESNPKDFAAYLNFGKALAEQGQLEQAIVAYREAIKINPNRPGTYGLVGNLQLKMGNLEEAITNYRKAIELNPNQPAGVYKNLGDAQFRKGDMEGAIANYQKAIELNPNQPAGVYKNPGDALKQPKQERYRGSFEGEELREKIRNQWKVHITKFLRDEITPLHDLVDPEKPLLAIDVGANKGFWSKAFIDFFGKRIVKIYAIDPSPTNIREITLKNDNLIFENQDLDLIVPVEAAVGHEKSTAFLYTNDDGSPLASLYEREISGSGPKLDQKYEVKVIKIDDFIENHKIDFVDVMKIDVEGNEMNVLLGAKESLSNQKIGTISFEFGIHQVYSRNFFKDFYKLFTDEGYYMYYLNREEQMGKKIPIPDYSYRWENFTKNFIFTASLYPAK